VSNYGRLGVPLNAEQMKIINSESHDLLPLKPSIVKFPDPTIIIQKVSSGSSFTLAMSTDGFVYSWGLGNSGGLGLGELSMTYTPTLIKQDKSGKQFVNIKNISCGSNHCLGLDGQGLVFSWGNGLGGRLGHGDETGENSPKEIAYFRENNIRVQNIQGGESNSAVITSKNELYIWGVGMCGKLGTGKT